MMRPCPSIHTLSLLLLLVVFGSATLAANDSESHHAKGRGDEVAVLYNSALPESYQVAQYYAAQRRVPSNQVFGLELPTEESIARKAFESKLARPLVDTLSNRDLITLGSPAKSEDSKSQTSQPASPARAWTQSSIRYLVLCFGVPTKIRESSEVSDNEDVQDLAPALQRNEAAVDSELAALPLRAKAGRLTGPLNNPAYGKTNRAEIHPTRGSLMVARLDGPSSKIAQGLVDKAMTAEKQGLWGRAYFDARDAKEKNYARGDRWIRNAARVCRQVGFETTLNQAESTFPNSFPMSHIALYAGWYDHQVSGPFTRPNIEFMPGAVAYHLHSFSAKVVRTEKRHWVGPLMAKGATATLGHVYEPYLELTPNIRILIHRFLAGFSFGEAAHAAQNVVSWQTTVVGDPLYRPFSMSLAARHRQLAHSNDPVIEWSYLMHINRLLARGVAPAKLIDQLKTAPALHAAASKSAVLQEKLGTLFQSQASPVKAAKAFDRALKQDPSRNQKIRLLKSAAELWRETDHPKKAFARYREVLRAFPEYPGRPAILENLEPLSKELSRTNALDSLR